MNTILATELHPNQASTINSPYLFVNTKITFTSCYLQGVPDEMGLSYLNDSVIYILHYLPPHVSAEGVVRRGVSTSYVGVYSSGYTDNGSACYFNITFTTKQGTVSFTILFLSLLILEYYLFVGGLSVCCVGV